MMLEKRFGIGLSADPGEVPAYLVFFKVFRRCRKMSVQTTEQDVYARQAESERHALSLQTTKPTRQQSSRHCESGERHAKI